MRALLEAARAGDRDAFGELVTMHESVVVRTALAALGRREDADDAAQDAFVMAWRKLASFRGESSFRTWLLKIVWRKALDRRRVRRLWWTRSQPPSPDNADDRMSEMPAQCATPEQQAMAEHLEKRIRAEIRRLSPKLRDALLLASAGEQSYDEIALVLGIPVGTLKWRVAEARRIIKKAMDRPCDAPRASE